MTDVADSLPLTETREPTTAAELATIVADAHAQGTAIYPIGGGTSLNFGMPPNQAGIGVSLSKLNRVIDYPARDMTITVEAGITLAALAEVMHSERQWLPIDVPQPAQATLGGVVATAFAGARRYGSGTMRDYVIGISAVDGRGMPFKGGGRVVKNVAGYDFCKLLTGSLGTLGVISQVTLKIKPQPESSAFLLCEPRDPETIERLLAAIVNSGTTPAAVELLAGPHWRDNEALGVSPAGSIARLAVGSEGTAAEVRFMLGQLAREWETLGVSGSRMVEGDSARALWDQLREFPHSPEAPLVVKASALPSQVGAMIRVVQELDPQASIQAMPATAS